MNANKQMRHSYIYIYIYNLIIDYLVMFYRISNMCLIYKISFLYVHHMSTLYHKSPTCTTCDQLVDQVFKLSITYRCV